MKLHWRCSGTRWSGQSRPSTMRWRGKKRNCTCSCTRAGAHAITTQHVPRRRRWSVTSPPWRQITKLNSVCCTHSNHSVIRLTNAAVLQEINSLSSRTNLQVLVLVLGPEVLDNIAGCCVRLHHSWWNLARRMQFNIKCRLALKHVTYLCARYNKPLFVDFSTNRNISTGTRVFIRKSQATKKRQISLTDTQFK